MVDGKSLELDAGLTLGGAASPKLWDAIVGFWIEGVGLGFGTQLVGFVILHSR